MARTLDVAQVAKALHRALDALGAGNYRTAELCTMQALGDIASALSDRTIFVRLETGGVK